MPITTRQDLDDFILYIENHYPVNEWKFNDIHIWPVLRIRLEYHIEAIRENWQKTENRKYNESTNNLEESALKKIIKLVKRIIAVFQFYRWILTIRKKRFLFISLEHYRTGYNNLSFNKFFDPLVEKYNLFDEASFIEMGPLSSTPKTNDKLELGYNLAIKYYFRLQALKRNLRVSNAAPLLKLQGYTAFLEYLRQFQSTSEFADRYSGEFLVRFFREWDQFYKFFQILFRKLQPERIFVLCYHDYYKMALIASANQMGIETIEMQHGPLRSLAYDKWTAIPKKGYDMLPRNFWCWDETSKTIIDGWAKNTGLYKSFIGGNPWIQFWAEKEVIYPNKNYILYTLQPLQPARLFPENIITFIKQNKYKWFIRLHPQQLTQKNEIMNYLGNKGVLNLVNIEEASNDPLPLILKNALLHITRYSGTVVEAELFNLHSVIIQATGVHYFTEQIETGSASFIDIDDQEFGIKLNILIKNLPISDRDNIECVKSKFVNELFS